MDPWRLTTRAQRRINFLAGSALASCVFAWLAGFGSASVERVSASVENTSAVSFAERSEPSLIASTGRPTNTPQAIVVASADTSDLTVATATESTPGKADDKATALDEPKPLVVASLPDPSQVLPPEAPSAVGAQASTPDPAPEKAADTAASSDEPKPFVVASLTDSSQVFSPEEVTAAPDTVLPAVSTLEINEECLVAEICIDRYLWALYERAPKIDAIKVSERRKVTIKRRGKTVTVTRTFTRRVDEEFGWKDPKAAEKAGMTMMDYVIGGMDRSFKLKLFHTLHAAEQAGLQPGITSAFRDDYRQSIASGLKAATDRSYHGGSLRGGYGRGLAADIVSVNGRTRAQRWVSTEKLWKWIDERGKEFGIGRPYLDRDPPHVAPIDGREYTSRRGGAKTQEAEAKTSKGDRQAVRSDKGKRLAARGDKGKRLAARGHSVTKQAKTVKLSKGAKTAKLSKGRTM
ncbi:hypothetical protein [Bradyrhizobium sp. 200]|uniref:hypothetical protein n=1 Tax=Bradyrhizobium sp. 200 TaxID=2782665 RepID=UPI001FFE3E3D|nr:hypothetical protein [Bradyrhizobium sp. 200]